MAGDLKPIYKAATVAKTSRAHTAVAGPSAVRKVVYSANAAESLHMSLRKIIQARGWFPSEEAALKLLYLALTKVLAKWETVQHCKQMVNTWIRCAPIETRKPACSEPTSRRCFSSPPHRPSHAARSQNRAWASSSRRGSPRESIPIPERLLGASAEVYPVSDPALLAPTSSGCSPA